MSTTLPSKELAELQRRFKQGYTVERQPNGHYIVLDRLGNKVMKESGAPLVLPGSPHGGRQTKNTEAELRKAGVLRGTPKRARVPVEQAKRNRAVALRATTEARGKIRQEEANALYGRLNPLVERLGGWEIDGMVADLAYVGAQIAREEGLTGRDGGRQMTPDLLTSSITRVKNRHWVRPDYQTIWNELAARLTQADSISDEFFGLIRKARHLPEQVVLGGQLSLPSGNGEWPFRVELLQIEQCLVDHSYQRPVPWPFVRRMAATFDETLVGTIDVAERGHGAVFAILDGQCRYEAMRLNGKTTVWASIYSGLDQQAEARFFLAKNGERKAIHPYYTFIAKLTAGIEQAVAIESIVKKFGYKVAMTSSGGKHDDRNISAVSSLEYAYSRSSDARPECLTPTLGTLKASTFGRASGQASTLIRGLGRFFQLHDEVDQARLDSVVASRGAEWLLGAAKERARGSGSAHVPVMARILAEEYNQGLPRGEKLRIP